MDGAVTRRDALVGVSAAVLAPACTLVGTIESGAFSHGVASGDPDTTSVIIWTRVSPAWGNRPIDWLVSDRRDFSRIVARGTATTGAERDFTVKVLVTALQPGGVYYYRFIMGDASSTVGRARTLPLGRIDELKLAIASCSNYPFGYFNAYDAIGRDDSIDLVLHLGDYIYESGADGWGGDVGSAIGRLHDPVHEIVTLADYRMRHAQYKSDAGSRRMHANHTLIPVWDDHESTNNPWRHGAQNHQPQTEGDWPTRRAMSLRAYYEWMPIRDPGDRNPAAYWRHYAWGDLASLVTLETRHTGRDRQINYREHIDSIDSQRDAERFAAEVLGDPGRSMLSQPMDSFLVNALAESQAAGRPWHIIGNQTLMARVTVPSGTAGVLEQSSARSGDPSGNELARISARISMLGRYGLPLNLDSWDGYGGARERLYGQCRDLGIDDLLVLTGDSHSFWINELIADGGQAMGYEVGTAGITSPGVFERFGPEASSEIDRMLAESNADILWTHNEDRGYVTVRLKRTGAAIDYIGVSQVESREYSTRVIRHVELQRVEDRLRLA